MTTEATFGQIQEALRYATRMTHGIRDYSLAGLLNYRRELIQALGEESQDPNMELQLAQTNKLLEAFLKYMIPHNNSSDELALQLVRVGAVRSRGEFYRIIADMMDKEDLPIPESEKVKKYPKIGIVGQIASGKGTVGQILEEKYGFESFPLSDRLREFAAGMGEFPPQTRAQLRARSDQLKSAHGNPIFVRWTLEMIDNMQSWRIRKGWEQMDGIAIDGFRSVEEARMFRSLPDTTLIAITADPDVRFQRLLSRARGGDDFSRPYFDESEEIEKAWIDPIIKIADVNIDNNGDQKMLHDQMRAKLEPWLLSKGVNK